MDALFDMDSVFLGAIGWAGQVTGSHAASGPFTVKWDRLSPFWQTPFEEGRWGEVW